MCPNDNAKKQKTGKTRRNVHEEFAKKIIAHLKAGTAPWQRPWHPGHALMVPHNPATGTVYHGVNRVNLALSGFDDPRWLTFNQANEQGLTIKAGSKAETIVFYRFTKEEDRLDDNGKPILDEDGKALKRKVELDRPITRFAHVFNAAQIENMPELKLTGESFSWDPIEKAESILEASGAVIKHDQSNRAFYRPLADEIHLPPRENFEDAARYYGTALHELGHWTGHSSRMDREFGPFGGEVYAREELRAEIASWMLGQDTGIPHDPEQHAAYVQSWIKALEEDPYEIHRACRDAEQIKEYVLDLERRKELGQERSEQRPEQHEEKDEGVGAMDNSAITNDGELAHERSHLPDIAKEKTFLDVPYKEKNRAKKFGARWDKEAKLWYAPEGTDLTPLSRWRSDTTPDPASASLQKTLNPQEEFAAHLAAAGLDLKGEAPIMDGKIHRVPLADDPPGTRNGAYQGFLDGKPNGWTHNFCNDERSQWSANGHTLSQSQLTALREEADAKRLRREQLQAEEYQRVADKCGQYFDERHPAPADHPYLVRKGISPDGVKVSPIGRELLIPAINADGEIRTLQYIAENGDKRFAPGGQKKGCFHLIGADAKDAKSLESAEIVLAEGYATGASIHMATQKPVAVAFDSGNLEAVAVALREKFPKAAITICADNDYNHVKKVDGKEVPYNVGIEKANQAAQAVGGKVVVPMFTEVEKARNLTDFNDLHASRGLEAVARQVGKARGHGDDRGLSL